MPQRSTTGTGIAKILAIAVFGSLFVGFFPGTRSVEAQTDVMIVGAAEAEPGDTGVKIPIKLSHARDIHAYSIALTFPTNVVTVRSLDICNTPIATQTQPDFHASFVESELGYATLGVITELDGATGEKALSGLPAGQERLIATLVLDVLPGAREGTYPIILKQGVGTANNVNETSSSGDSVEPLLRHGFIRVGTKNILHVSSALGFCGAQPRANLFVRGNNTDELNGLSIGVTFDWRHAEIIEIVPGLDITREMGPPNSENFELAQMDWTRIGDRCRVRVGFIFDAAPPFDETQVLPPHTGTPDREYLQISIRPRFEQLNCATLQRIPFELEEIDQPGILNNAFVVGTSSLTPKLYDGGVYFCTGSVRGRVVNGATGQPIAGARVEIEPTFQSAMTGATGGFGYSDLPPGKYLFRVTHGDEGDFFPEIRAGVEVGCGTFEENDLGDIVLHPITRAACGGNSGTGQLSTFDNNQDGRHDIADIFPVVGYLFQGRPEPAIFCLDAIEANGDGRVDLSDAIYFLNYLFGGGASPIAPFPECGTRETEILGCERHRCDEL